MTPGSGIEHNYQINRLAPPASASPEARAAELLGRLTLEEKLAQLVCLFGQERGSIDGFPPGLVPGAITHFVRASNLPPRAAAAAVAELQRRFRESARVPIPILVCEEAVCGLEVDGATLFPDGLGLAASWDADLLRRVGEVVHRQMVALGVRNAWGPLCDVARDARWGRGEETYGEDPYLVGCLAAAYTAAVQQEDVAVTLKHFVAYSASEGGRNLQAAHLGERELREVHLLPFEMAIAAGARGAMASYNTIDQVPVQGSRELLTGVLREELELPGVLVSDYGSVEHLHSRHGVTDGPAESGALALRAGLDVDLSGACFRELPAALERGLASLEDVDRAAARVLAEKFRLGLFDAGDASPPPPELELPADRALAREAAARAIVLLRNEPAGAGRPLLPLAPDLASLAVIGPNADRKGALLGNYSYPVMARAIEIFFGAADPSAADPERKVSPDAEVPVPGTVPVPTVLEALRAAAPAGVEVRHARGCPVAEPDRSGIAGSVELARASGAAVVVLGDQAGLFTASTVGEGVDSAYCRLPGVQRELLEAVVATGTPTIAVFLGGRPVEFDWAAGLPAVLAGWFPGEEGGPALAEILFGRREPGGRLPLGLVAAAGVTPLPYTAVQSQSYVDAAARPLFEFGFGLGYTTFEYSDLEIAPGEIRTDGTAAISCTVRNTGDRPGEEVVQLYLRDPVARTARPRRELKGFQRIALEAGASRRLRFQLHADRTALYDPGPGWVVEPGLIEVMVGSSSERLPLRGELRITGEPRATGGGRQLWTPVT